MPKQALIPLVPNKRQKVGVFDITTQREEIKMENNYLRKLSLLVSLHDDLPVCATFAKPGDRRWYYRVKPVISCFRECCGGEMANFQEKYTHLNLSRKFKCADGLDHKCAPT